MTELLLEWVFTSAFLILVVLALRAALGRRMSAGLRYGLWAVVLVRLLVPVQLFTSPLAGTWVVTEKRTEQIVDGVEKFYNPDEDEILNNLGGQAGPSVTLTAFPNAPAPPTLPNAPEPPSPPDLTKAPGWLGWAWLAGSAAVAAVLLLSNLRFFWRLRRARIPLDEADHPLRVYVSVGLPSPCLFGIFRPAVYVTPEAAADPDMLRHVLAHEYTHYRHGDHIWSLLRCAALAAHWWNPLVWLAAVLSRRDAELACDEGALKRLGDGERAGYGSTLLALVTAKPGPGDLFRCTTTMSGDKKSLKERISRIACAPKRVMWAVIVAVLVTALACVCAFGQAEPAEEQDPAPSADPTVSGDPLDAQVPDLEELLTHFTADTQGVPEDVLYFMGKAVCEKYDEYLSYVETAPYWDADIGFDGWRVQALNGPWHGTACDMDLEVWQVNYEFLTTTPETAVNLVNGGAYLNDDGWLCPTYPNCTYVIFLANEGGKLGYLTSVMANDCSPDSPSGLFYETVAMELERKGLASLDFLPQTDLNRNGVPETLQVSMIDGGAGQRLEVWEGDELIFSEEGYYAHAGYNALFLYRDGKADYLLRYNPYGGQGWMSYSYTLFTLENGEETAVRENSLEFDINFHPLQHQSFDAKVINAFMGEINPLLAGSVQLLNTDADLLATFEKEGRLYDSLGWLDWWEPTFVRDESKSLLNNLLDFQTAMEKEADSSLGGVYKRYLAVIQGEEPLYSPEHRERMTLDELCAETGPGYTRTGISDFSVLDLDGDGAQEVILGIDTSGYHQWCIVLHEQDGEVRGYALYIRWLNTLTLKEDGAFDWSSSAFENGWGKLRFTETGYETIRTIWVDQGGTYYLGDRVVSQAEYDAANDQQEAVPDAEWHEFSEENMFAAFFKG